MSQAQSILPRSAGKVIAELQRLRRAPALSAAPESQCDLCAAPINERHEHLLDVTAGKLMCACHPCALLFSNQNGKKFRLVPSRVEFLPGLQIDDLQWNSLGVPINLAFIFRSSAKGMMLAVYPSPGGATESELPADAWEEIVTANPQLAEMNDDIEALLVNRTHGAREYFLVSTDHCYQLVGIVRKHWRGMSGGTEIWKELGRFFEQLKKMSKGARDA